jgi:hypothetical protein
VGDDRWAHQGDGGGVTVRALRAWGTRGGGLGRARQPAGPMEGARGGRGWAAAGLGRGGGGRRPDGPWGASWARLKGGRGDFPLFPFSYLALTSLQRYFSRITQPQARKSWSGMMQQPRKIFLGFTYTRYRAKSR